MQEFHVQTNIFELQFTTKYPIPSKFKVQMSREKNLDF